jgi:hypothetical protein
MLMNFLQLLKKENKHKLLRKRICYIATCTILKLKIENIKR